DSCASQDGPWRAPDTARACRGRWHRASREARGDEFPAAWPSDPTSAFPSGHPRSDPMTLTFPGESAEYRRARDQLLDDEIELRRAMERVAVARRALPLGGAVPEDYEFVGADGRVRLSELFDGPRSLAIYHWMFPRHAGDDRPAPPSGPLARWPLEETPCPSCTALLDQLDGAAAHVAQNMSLVVVAGVEFAPMVVV